MKKLGGKFDVNVKACKLRASKAFHANGEPKKTKFGKFKP